MCIRDRSWIDSSSHVPNLCSAFCCKWTSILTVSPWVHPRHPSSLGVRDWCWHIRHLQRDLADLRGVYDWKSCAWYHNRAHCDLYPHYCSGLAVNNRIPKDDWNISSHTKKDRTFNQGYGSFCLFMGIRIIGTSYIHVTHGVIVFDESDVESTQIFKELLYVYN